MFVESFAIWCGPKGVRINYLDVSIAEEWKEEYPEMRMSQARFLCRQLNDNIVTEIELL